MGLKGLKGGISLYCIRNDFLTLSNVKKKRDVNLML